MTDIKERGTEELIRHVTVGFTIRDSEAFQPKMKEFCDSMRDSNAEEDPFSVTFISRDSEAQRIELIEEVMQSEEIEIHDAMFTINKILQTPNIGNVANLKALEEL